MDQIELTVQHRSITGKQVKKLRVEGLMPLIVYGRRVEPVNLQASELEVKRAISQAGGQLIALSLEDEGTPRMVLARDIQRDSISGTLLHADLYEVDMSETVQVAVPLALVGEPPLVNTGEAVLVPILNSVEIECLPSDIVQSFQVDVSGLVNMDDAIYVRDLEVPETIEMLTSEDEMIARLQYVVEEEEEEEEEEFEFAPSVDDVEVIQRGAEEEEEEEED
jgi:large subunit ribosomal protein L25